MGRFRTGAIDGRERMYGLPIEVHFAGFRANTRQLGNAGWKLLSEFDIERRQHKFVFRHEGFDLWGIADSYSVDRVLAQPHGSHPAFPIMVGPHGVGRDIIIQGRMPNYQWVDINTEPELLPSNEYIQRVRMSGLFPPAQDDVYVEEADHDVLDYLQKIVEMQRPKQAELREKVKNQEQPQVKETARIIQLGAYR